MTARRTTKAASPVPDARAPLLTLPEVAALLHLGLRTVQAMRSAGTLRVLKFGKAARVEPAEVERLIREARS